MDSASVTTTFNTRSEVRGSLVPMNVTSSLWFAVALHVGVASIASAQIDTAALRDVKRRATETFLDSTRPTRERLQAATRLGYPEPSTFARLLQVGTNRREPDTIRLVALKRSRYD